MEEDLFVNHYEHTLDSKNRVVLPAKFRAQLGERVYLAPQANSLGVYSKEQYAEMIGRLVDRVRAREVPPKAREALASLSVEVDIDGAGRITIPARLREYANLTGDVIISGAVRHVKIWDRERFEQEQEEFAAVVREQFKDGGIFD